MANAEQIFPLSDKRYLSDDAVLWRYVPLRTLFFYLDGLVFIPSIAQLKIGDPFEGKFYDEITWFNQAFSDRYQHNATEIDNWMLNNLCSDAERKLIEINKNNQHSPASLILRKHYFDFVGRTRFAWCWFQSNRESAPMWKVYGNQGVAIKTTIGNLSVLFEKTQRSFIFGKMTYVDYEADTNLDPSLRGYPFLLRPYFLKRKEYESENEVRFVTAASERVERGGVLIKNLNPQGWISAIRLWPGLTYDEEQSIRKAVHAFLPNIDCQKSDLFTDSNNEFASLDFDIEEASDSEWKTGEDGIPQSLKQL
ncbi:MAG TPA: hypothetical protein VGN23_08765 [Verrucomicrobiae bacterium]|jgi:hypothetical protein